MTYLKQRKNYFFTNASSVGIVLLYMYCAIKKENNYFGVFEHRKIKYRRKINEVEQNTFSPEFRLEPTACAHDFLYL